MNLQKANDQSFLGTGWNFPPTFTKEHRGAKMVSGIEDICQSLHILLSTRFMERVMQPAYGCNLDTLLFDPMNNSFFGFVRKTIENNIRLYEPRIQVDLEDIQFEKDEYEAGKLLIKIDFKVRSTNNRFNFVYPFYLSEAEVVQQNILGIPPIERYSNDQSS